MKNEKKNRRKIVFGAVLLLLLVVVGGLLCKPSQVATLHNGEVPSASNVGESTFINTQQEYASGNSSQLGLWYTWVNTGNTQVVFLALDFQGLQFMGSQLRSPVSMVVGQHFNTSEGDVFVANSPRYLEIFNDTNGNGVPDANFTAGYSEIQYYVIMNSSGSFQANAVDKYTDTNGITHYKWGVRYNDIDALLVYPFFETYPPKHPVITVSIDHVQCTYDFYISGNTSYLKIGFEIGQFLNPRVYGKPTTLTLDNESLSILFSTMIVSATSTYQLSLGGGAYNSTTAKIPVTPTNETALALNQSKVYDFLFGGNYTLTTNSGTNTYSSKAAACSNASVSSPYLVSTGGPLVFSRWGPEAKVIEDLIPRISSTLDVASVMNQTSSFYYRVSYPKWGNGTLVDDPTYIANLGTLNLNPPPSGTLNQNELSGLQIATVVVTVGTGIAMLSFAIVRLRRTPKMSSQFQPTVR